MQKPAICPREEIDSNNFRGKIRVTLAEKLLGRRIEFGLSIFLSFETRTLENQPTSEKNDLISRVIYLRLWRLGCQAVPSFFFFLSILFLAAKDRALEIAAIRRKYRDRDQLAWRARVIG